MKKMYPLEVLNDNMDYLVDYLARELKCLGKMNGLSDSQISGMERDFIARLAFAAIIGDDEKEEDDCESCPAKDRCSFKEPEKKPEKEPDKKIVPDEVWKALRYVKNHCDLDCDDCPFGSSGGLFCRLNDKPSDWEV